MNINRRQKNEYKLYYSYWRMWMRRLPYDYFCLKYNNQGEVKALRFEDYQTLGFKFQGFFMSILGRVLFNYK